MKLKVVLPFGLVAASAAIHGYYGLGLYPSMLTAIWCSIIFVLVLYGMFTDASREIVAEVSMGLGLTGTIWGFIMALNAGGVAGLETSALSLALLTTLFGTGGAVLLRIQHWIVSHA